jgi:transcriptional regulator with PAS, ATPase and Fis domain
MLVFDAGRPLRGGARFTLAGADEVVVGYGEGRQTKRRQEGRKVTLAVTIDDRAVSETHARLRATSEGWLVEDLGSRNGSYVNGVRAAQVILGRGDLLTVGRSFFLIDDFEVEDGSDVDASDVAAVLPGLLTLLPSYAAALANLSSIARTTKSVTLVGETGTGKELLARAVHQLSGRTGPYNAVNCAALARTLIESELFGYVKGAFSGALKNHPGHIQAADRGTLLLDEILAAPPEFQAALLRVLQENVVTPVGGRKPVPVDVRIVAAAQRALDDAVAHDGFRADLKARLEGFVLRVPPLRERMADTGIFVAHALRAEGVREGDRLSFTLDAALELLRHDWPGNVRELAAAVGRARTLAPDGVVDVEHLVLPSRPDDERTRDPDELRRDLITNLRLTRGDVAATAKRMGRNRSLVYKWLDRFGIDYRAFRNGGG